MQKKKELQKLNRLELLELLLDQKKENEELLLRLEEKEKAIEKLREELENRTIDLNKAGTIAEASFKLNGVFQSAEKAAQQYLDNLQALYEKEEQMFQKKEEEALKKCRDVEESVMKQCKELWEKTEAKCKAREQEAEERCAYLDQKAKEDVEKRWNSLIVRLDEFYGKANK